MISQDNAACGRHDAEAPRGRGRAAVAAGRPAVAWRPACACAAVGYARMPDARELSTQLHICIPQDASSLESQYGYRTHTAHPPHTLTPTLSPDAAQR